MKVKIFRSDRLDDLEITINAFIQDKEVCDIRHNTILVHPMYNERGIPMETTSYETVIVLYKED